MKPDKLKLIVDVGPGTHEYLDCPYVAGEEFFDRTGEARSPDEGKTAVSKTENGGIFFLPAGALKLVIPELRKVSTFPVRTEPYVSYCDGCEQFFLNDTRDHHAECPDCQPARQLYHFNSYAEATGWVRTQRRYDAAKKKIAGLFGGATVVEVTGGKA